MTFVLLILLAIALSVTLAGFLFTFRPKMQVRRPQRMSYAEQNKRPLRRREYVNTNVLRTNSNRFGMGGKVKPRSNVYSLTSMVGVLTRGRRTGEPLPWTGVAVVLVAIFLLGLYLLRALLPNTPLIGYLPWASADVSQSSSSGTQNAPQAPINGASLALIRVSQLDPKQYNSSQEYDLWAYSACSAAAMTEVINAYGHHYRVTDILKVESQLGEITPDQGLLEDIGLQRTATRFHFKTTWGSNLSLDEVIAVANSGKPVIVDFPPDKYSGGHLLVVTGGNNSVVLLADSSLWNRHSVSRAQFLQWWAGFSAILTPM